MGRYVLSPAAQISLKDIRSHSLEQFGSRQTTRYLKTLRDRMRQLAANPSAGKPRDDIKAGYRCAFVGSHTIYYRVSDTHIDIIDVLHQRMEPTLHL
ncbi:MAG: type II toxin-antitoxin system RelE/ParE family toxin [Pseudomonadota bacterium]